MGYYTLLMQDNSANKLQCVADDPTVTFRLFRLLCFRNWSFINNIKDLDKISIL